MLLGVSPGVQNCIHEVWVSTYLTVYCQAETYPHSLNAIHVSSHQSRTVIASSVNLYSLHPRTHLLTEADNIHIDLLFLESLCQFYKLLLLRFNRTPNKCNYAHLVVLTLPMLQSQLQHFEQDLYHRDSQKTIDCLCKLMILQYCNC